MARDSTTRPKQDSKALSPDELTAMMTKLNREREESCLAKVQEALEEFGCQMIPVVMVRGGEISTNIEIVCQ